MKPDKKDCLKQKDGRESGKFKLVRYRQITGVDGRQLYALIWASSGRSVYIGEWQHCIAAMNNCIKEYKLTNGKPHPWQFIGPVTYYNAMDRYIARQKEQIAAEQKK